MKFLTCAEPCTTGGKLPPVKVYQRWSRNSHGAGESASTNEVRGLVRQRLNNDGDALAAADASSRQSIAQALAAQFVEHGDDEARARSGQRMAERDCAAVDVGFVAVEAEFFFHCKILYGKRFIHFDAIHLF